MIAQRSIRIHQPNRITAPLSLRAVTTEAAAAARQQAQVFRATAECDGQLARLTLRSCTPPASPAWGLILDTRHGKLVWCAPSALWQTLSGIDPDAGPEHSRLTLCEAALALLPTSLRTLLGEPVARAVWQAGAPLVSSLTSPSSTPIWQQLDCRLDEVTLTSHLAADTRCWQALLKTSWRAAPSMPWMALAQVPLAVSVVMGELQLTLAESRTLNPGDVLRLRACRFDTNGVGWVDLAAGRLAVYWREDRGHFIFYQFETRTMMQSDDEDGYESDYEDDYESGDEGRYGNDRADDDEHDDDDVDRNPEDEPDESEDDDDADYDRYREPDEPATDLSPPSAPVGIPAATLEQLPIRLKVVLGEFELPLQTLRTLASGAVLELAQGLPPQVTLEAQGRLLGQGELVTLDGALAVQLLSWLDTPQGLPS